MNCSEFDIWLSRPRAEWPAEAGQHLDACPRCLALAQALDTPRAAVPTELADSLARQLTRDLTPVRPMRAGLMTAGLAVAFALIVGLGIARLGASALPVLTAVQTASIFTALIVSVALLARTAVRLSIPGSRLSPPPLVLDILIPAGLAAIVTALFVLDAQDHFLLRAWTCFRAGVPFGMATGVVTWLILRNGFVVDTRLTGATAGLLSGLAGTSMLSLHCPNMHAWHILAGHVTVALAGLLAGLAIGHVVERRRTA